MGEHFLNGFILFSDNGNLFSLAVFVTNEVTEVSLQNQETDISRVWVSNGRSSRSNGRETFTDILLNEVIDEVERFSDR